MELRQEDCWKFKDRLGSRVRPYLRVFLLSPNRCLDWRAGRERTQGRRWTSLTSLYQKTGKAGSSFPRSWSILGEHLPRAGYWWDKEDIVLSDTTISRCGLYTCNPGDWETEVRRQSSRIAWATYDLSKHNQRQGGSMVNHLL